MSKRHRKNKVRIGEDRDKPQQTQEGTKKKPLHQISVGKAKDL